MSPKSPRSPERIGHHGSLSAKANNRIGSRRVRPGEAARQNLVAEEVAGPRHVGIGGILLP